MVKKTDIEIARSIALVKIDKIAEQIGIGENNLHHYGKYIAKLPIQLIDTNKIKKSNLILVTAITPTKAGIGKTTTSIGLSLGLSKLGKKSIVTLREPSLGPCFGMKGGAAGGGYAQVLPMEDINLHFTGDFHAITSAHNMITALLDNYQFRNQATESALKSIVWKRVLDVNDRNLRNIVTGLNGQMNGVVSESGFDITPASELMAILCLAKDMTDLKRRISKIILGYKNSDEIFTVNDLGITGAITILLKDALNPNLVQTTENTPSIIHGGPFANIAHGCNSIIATKMAMTHAEYVITEAGFGADLGAEKFFNIKCRKAGLNPKITVLVVTTQALKMHGTVPLESIKEENIEGLKKGFENLDKHIENIRSFGQTVIVAVNQFGSDTDKELKLIKDHCLSNGITCTINNSFTEGSKGALELAEKVIQTINNQPSGALQFTYEESDSTEEKINKIAKSIYGAANVKFSDKAKKQLKQIEKLNIGNYPVCIAKTQYSFSDNAKAYGRPTGFTITINDIVINNGAEFIVAITGNIMRMPGLPSDPQANHMDIRNGQIEGLS